MNDTSKMFIFRGRNVQIRTLVDILYKWLRVQPGL
jgi:hypothetical protein